jgi:DNA polymerase-3 subunit delta
MDSLTFLEKPDRMPLRPVFVLHGDEAFLKRQVLAALQQRVLGDAGEAFGLSTHAGDRATFAAVVDELTTLPLFAPRRLIVVENADPFVTRFRSNLEKHVAKIADNKDPRGVLVLDVKTWPANTKLAKLLAEGTVTCKALPAARLPAWCVQRAATHGKQLPQAAAQLLVDLVGPEMGQLDQELAKLAVHAGDAKRIDAAAVDALVGRSRTETVWKIFDAIGAGQPGRALAILDQMLEQGDDPMAVLGGFSWQLRKLAQVYRLTRLGRSLPAALEELGVSAFSGRGLEQQLRALGRRRAERLFDWLLEVDLGMKGGSALPPRLLLERLIIHLARPYPLNPGLGPGGGSEPTPAPGRG